MGFVMVVRVVEVLVGTGIGDEIAVMEKEVVVMLAVRWVTSWPGVGVA